MSWYIRLMLDAQMYHGLQIRGKVHQVQGPTMTGKAVFPSVTRALKVTLKKKKSVCVLQSLRIYTS